MGKGFFQVPYGNITNRLTLHARLGPAGFRRQEREREYLRSSSLLLYWPISMATAHYVANVLLDGKACIRDDATNPTYFRHRHDNSSI